jgi:hypothetical protein
MSWHRKTFAIGSARAQPRAVGGCMCGARADFPAGTTAFGPSWLRIAISFPGKISRAPETQMDC